MHNIKKQQHPGMFDDAWWRQYFEKDEVEEEPERKQARVAEIHRAAVQILQRRMELLARITRGKFRPDEHDYRLLDATPVVLDRENGGFVESPVEVDDMAQLVHHPGHYVYIIVRVTGINGNTATKYEAFVSPEEYTVLF
jgi:hypothetical protein